MWRYIFFAACLLLLSGRTWVQQSEGTTTDYYLTQLGTIFDQLDQNLILSDEELQTLETALKNLQATLLDYSDRLRLSEIEINKIADLLKQAEKRLTDYRGRLLFYQVTTALGALGIIILSSLLAFGG